MWSTNCLAFSLHLRTCSVRPAPTKGIVMRSQLFRLAVPALLLSCVLGCHDNKTTTAPGAVANVMFNAPDSAKSGQNFTVDVNALNVGINGIHNAQIAVMVP